VAVSGPKGSGGVFADINITPLTDIFLVLLIIFMVTTSVTVESAQHNSSRMREPAVLAIGFANGSRVRGKRVHGTGHLALMSATVVSSIRFENPHSLSYQLDTLTNRPDTLVSVASNVDDAGSWLKSTDTSGAVL